MELELSPLRERGDAVEALGATLLTRSCEKLGRGGLDFADAAPAAMRAYSWPGNVRELEDVIDYAVLCCEGSQLKEEHLPEGLYNMAEAPHSTARPEKKFTHASENIPGMIADCEKKKINECLEKNRWNKSKSAIELGLTRAQLLYRMKKYGIG